MTNSPFKFRTMCLVISLYKSNLITAELLVGALTGAFGAVAGVCIGVGRITGVGAGAGWVVGVCIGFGRITGLGAGWVVGVGIGV
jgi:hypothetical protein